RVRGNNGIAAADTHRSTNTQIVAPPPPPRTDVRTRRTPLMITLRAAAAGHVTPYGQTWCRGLGVPLPPNLPTRSKISDEKDNHSVVVRSRTHRLDTES